MTCRLSGAKTLSKPVLGYCQLDTREQTSVKSDQNTKLFIYENPFEFVVSEMVVISSRGVSLICICEKNSYNYT